MNIDELTLGQIKQLQNLFGDNQSANEGINYSLGEKVIIRTYSAGNWFGTLEQKSGKEVVLKNARRLWYWKAEKGISLSAVALDGINQNDSRIVAPVDGVWLEAIEIIPCTDKAIKSIEGADHAESR